MIYRGPYLVRWQILHLAMTLACKAQTRVAAAKSNFFSDFKKL
jgi:hypothetical protein